MQLSARFKGALFGACVLLGGLVVVAHAATLRMTIGHAIIGTYQGTAGAGTPTFQLGAGNQAALVLGNGTGTGQANMLYSSTGRTLAASATEQLDLFGSLTDPFGTTINFATVKVIKVCANSNNTNNVNVGGATSNALAGVFTATTSKLGVKPGGCFTWAAPQTGATVTASTADLLEFGNSSSGSSVSYDVYMIGTQ